jgi:hypothetical protein
MPLTASPVRQPSPEQRALLRVVRRMRLWARALAVFGVLSACAGFVAIAAGEWLSPLTLMLPLGLAIALAAERRLAKLAAADRRIRVVAWLPAAVLAGAAEGGDGGDP